MPARKSQNTPVSPSKTRNGMQLWGGAHAKIAAAIHHYQEEDDPSPDTDSTSTDEDKHDSKEATQTIGKKRKASKKAKKASKRPKVEDSAKKVAAEAAKIAKLAAIEDKLAKVAQKAALAHRHCPEQGECSTVSSMCLSPSYLEQCNTQQRSRFGSWLRARRTIAEGYVTNPCNLVLLG